MGGGERKEMVVLEPLRHFMPVETRVTGRGRRHAY